MVRNPLPGGSNRDAMLRSDGRDAFGAATTKVAPVVGSSVTGEVRGSTAGASLRRPASVGGIYAEGESAGGGHKEKAREPESAPQLPDDFLQRMLGHEAP